MSTIEKSQKEQDHGEKSVNVFSEDGHTLKDKRQLIITIQDLKI